jgi:hypothetical protein
MVLPDVAQHIDEVASPQSGVQDDEFRGFAVMNASALAMSSA